MNDMRKRATQASPQIEDRMRVSFIPMVTHRVGVRRDTRLRRALGEPLTQTPKHGTFTTPDPLLAWRIGLHGDCHPDVKRGDDPVNMSDPWGLRPGGQDGVMDSYPPSGGSGGGGTTTKVVSVRPYYFNLFGNEDYGNSRNDWASPNYVAVQPLPPGPDAKMIAKGPSATLGFPVTYVEGSIFGRAPDGNGVVMSNPKTVDVVADYGFYPNEAWDWVPFVGPYWRAKHYEAQGEYGLMFGYTAIAAFDVVMLLTGVTEVRLAVAGRRVAARGGMTAYETALAGGRHSGWLKTVSKWSTSELQTSIGTMKANIVKHQKLISNPEKYLQQYHKGNWNLLHPNQQQHLLKVKWPGDIQRAEEQINILQEIIKLR